MSTPHVVVQPHLGCDTATPVLATRQKLHLTCGGVSAWVEAKLAACAPPTGESAWDERGWEAGTALTCVLVGQPEDLKGAEAQERGRQAEHGAAAFGDGLAAVQGVPDHARVRCHHAPCARRGDALRRACL